ncbi:SIR2 family NAD-dependent protein deacylase [Luteimonas dalianensis]|uniref:SIR2 family NAD-dependent protein deacylase n=1 Tax=Luteimonas dalianensis TaxID=1148196 RepID=UPI003BF3D170
MQITVITGAGMSADSGIPTFRDALTGLWARFDPQRLATPEAFHEDPALVWGWYRWRAALVLRAQPNAGHLGLARLEDAGHEVTVVTQNVDDLHERAGSSRVLHLHGSLFASRCIDCGRVPATEPLGESLDAVAADGARETPPACTACGCPLRPGVVWFGEGLPEDQWLQAQDAVAGCDLALVIGTSSLVYPAAALPLAALQAGTPVLEINPQPTALSTQADASWRLTASAGVERLLARLQALPHANPADLLP